MGWFASTSWRRDQVSAPYTPSDRRSQFRFVYHEPFSDALALLELYALSSGKPVAVFRQWQSFAQRVKYSQEEEAPPPARRRRRRKG